jgi:serine/threonine protein kinase
MAPEVLKNTEPTSKVDVWAVGVIFYQMISALKHPFEAKNIHEMSYSIAETQYHPLSTTVSPFVQQLINQMLKKNPLERPDASSILHMKEI